MTTKNYSKVSLAFVTVHDQNPGEQLKHVTTTNNVAHNYQLAWICNSIYKWKNIWDVSWDTMAQFKHF